MLCITFLTEKVTNSIHNMTYDADGLKSSMVFDFLKKLKIVIFLFLECYGLLLFSTCPL